MVLIILFLLLTVLPLTAVAQKTAFEAVVIDAQNRRPLPFASVYVNQSASTITNAEGAFTIRCDTADVLRVSYVGYRTVRLQASQAGRIVELQPMENMLQEVTVKPLDLKTLIRKTTRETRRQLRKYEKRESCFFYRQTSFSDTTCFELMEAFLKARSAVFLQDLFLLKGRFAGIQPDSLHRYAFYTNFFTVSELPMLTRYDYTGNTDVKPLTRNHRDFYDLDYDILADGDDRLVAVHFTPKEHVRKAVLDVTLYIDPKTYRLRKMEGRNRNVRTLHKDYYVQQLSDSVKTLKKVISLDTATFNLTVNMTEERGFLEVQSVYIDEQHEQYGKPLLTRSILFNVGIPKLSHLTSDLVSESEGSRVRSFGDLHKYIREQGYDPEFWHENETVRLTPLEERVMRLFEHQNLFGTMEPDRSDP